MPGNSRKFTGVFCSFLDFMRNSLEIPLNMKKPWGIFGKYLGNLPKFPRFPINFSGISRAFSNSREFPEHFKGNLLGKNGNLRMEIYWESISIIYLGLVRMAIIIVILAARGSEPCVLYRPTT